MSKTVIPVAILSPQDTKQGSVVNLAGKGELWRKQILPRGSINYQGRRIRFDNDYHRELVQNFKNGAYPQVPFQLADATNTHTNDPERTRGQMVDLRAEHDGLYGYFKMTDPTVVLNNQDLGVSCRIIEGYTRESDNKYFGRSLQHVLGTLDPRVVGMKPWESVELAGTQTDAVVDLSNQFYTKDGGEMPDGTETKHVVELSTAQLERLNELLAQEEETEEEDADLDGAFDGLRPEDFADGEEDEELTDELEDGGQDSVALAAVSNLQSQVLELTNKLERRDGDVEMAQLAATGLAPAILEAARPLLAIQSGTIELSNGDQVSPAKQVRTLLRTVLDLSNKGLDVVSFEERGSLGGDDSAQGLRNAQVEQMEREYGS
jgi:hypothetical protein